MGQFPPIFDTILYTITENFVEVLSQRILNLFKPSSLCTTYTKQNVGKDTPVMYVIVTTYNILLENWKHITKYWTTNNEQIGTLIVSKKRGY